MMDHLELTDQTAKLMLAGAAKYRPKPFSIAKAVKVDQPFALEHDDPFPAGSYLVLLTDGSIMGAKADQFECNYEPVPKRIGLGSSRRTR
jgi:hypothetical protein